MLKLLLSIVMIAFVGMAKAEDGSKLWLRAEKNVKAKNVVTFKGKSDATTQIAVKEGCSTSHSQLWIKDWSL